MKKTQITEGKRERQADIRTLQIIKQLKPEVDANQYLDYFKGMFLHGLKDTPVMRFEPLFCKYAIEAGFGERTKDSRKIQDIKEVIKNMYLACRRGTDLSKVSLNTPLEGLKSAMAAFSAANQAATATNQYLNNESKSVSQKLIRLTESDLHQIVKESVKRIISETLYARKSSKAAAEAAKNAAKAAWAAGASSPSFSDPKMGKEFLKKSPEEREKFLKKIGLKK